MFIQKQSFAIICLVTLILQGCDDPSIAPTPFEYPISLSGSQGQFAVTLEWQEVSVSTFEEYFILRSQDSIPDTPEPEITGLTTLVTRIDQQEITTFTDSQFPISQTLYYKAYAKIGDRFLMSPTVRVDLDLQVFNLRADALTVDIDEHVIIAYDRSQQLLFAYDYISREILEQRQHFFNVPLIHFGTYNGSKEIYLSDRSTSLFIINRETLVTKQTMFTTYNIQDFKYDDERFFIARDGPSSSSLAVYRRSNLTLAEQINSVINFTRNVQVLGESPEQKVMDLAINQMARYSVTGTDISQDFLKQVVVSGSQVFSSVRPGQDEIVLTNNGHIVNSNIESITTLDGGSRFFQSFAFSPDGDRLFGSAFNLNTVEISIYDATSNYALIKRIPINFSPTRIFADDENVYAVGLVFLGGVNKTIISKFAYE